MDDDARVGKAGSAVTEIGHNSAMLDDKRETMYHNKRDRVFVRGIQGHYNVKQELERLARRSACTQGQGQFTSSTGHSASHAITSSPRTASRRPSTCIWKNMRPALRRRSTAM